MKIKFRGRLTSLTGRPKVVPERAALTASVDPRRGAPTTQKIGKLEDK
jgi:hypothetical protein